MNLKTPAIAGLLLATSCLPASAYDAIYGQVNGSSCPPSNSYGTGSYQPFQLDAKGNACVSGQVSIVSPASGGDPCLGSVKSQGDFGSTTSGGSIITAVSAKKAYICSIAIVTSAAANVSLVEGTGSSVCTSGVTAGVFLNTGTTAANGAAFSANGGLSQGGGGATLAVNATANQNICVVFTTTNSPQVNVHVSYVQQ